MALLTGSDMGERFRRAKITASVIDKLGAGEMVMDTDEPGFGVRKQGEAAVFFVRKHAHGRRHFETIGAYGTGDLTVSTARDRAKKLVVAIRDGHSPTERRAKEQAMKTVAELADDWLAEHVTVKLKASTARLYRSTLTTIILPTLGKMRVDHVHEDTIARMHAAARATLYAANRSLAILSKLMGYAERRGYRPRGSNPVKGIERFREQRRERFLSREELVRLGEALADPVVTSRHSPYALAAIAMLLLTGMRLNEVLKLRWSEVDSERGLLLLSDSKTGRKPIILGEPALRLLADMPRMESDWVFPGAKDGQPLHDVKKAWRSVVAVARLTGLRIHDLRHTYAAEAAGLGGSLPAIGRLLGHSQPATTARYAHLARDPVKELANQTAENIAAHLRLSSSRREGRND